MKLTISRADLVKAMASVSRVIERRNTIPILSNVRLSAGAHGLDLTGTDLDLVLRARAPAEVELPGEVTVPATILHDIARKMPEGAEIDIDYTSPEGPTGAGGKVVVRSGRSRFALQSLPATDFPNMESGEMPTSFRLSAGALTRMIGSVDFAISTDETRYYLNGIYLHANEGPDGPVLRAVATDGHRLARIEMALPEGAAGLPGVIVPRKTVGEIKRMADAAGNDDIVLALSPQKILIEQGSTRLVSKLIDGTFPDYQRVIPAGNDRLVVLDAAGLREAIDRVSTVSSERGRAVRMLFDDTGLRLSMMSPDHGTAEESIDCDWKGAALEIGFNGRYAADVLGTLDAEKVEVRLAEPGSPVIWQREDDASLLCVLMPMRL